MLSRTRQNPAGVTGSHSPPLSMVARSGTSTVRLVHFAMPSRSANTRRRSSHGRSSSQTSAPKVSGSEKPAPRDVRSAGGIELGYCGWGHARRYPGMASERGGYPWTRHLQDCSRSGPGVDQLVALPNELEAEGIGADSKFRDGWVCLGCFNRGVVRRCRRRLTPRRFIGEPST